MGSNVALVKVAPDAEGEAVHQALTSALDLLGGPAEFCSPRETVLVKPNFSGPHQDVAVSPPVTAATLRILSDTGCRVLVGEDPSVSVPEEEVYEFFGLHDAARAAGAEVVSLRHGPHVLVDVPDAGCFEAIEVSQFARDAGLVVSLARMKAVNICHVTLSLKNMKGVIAPAWKRRFHCDDLNQGIVDLNRVVRPRLAIVDAIRATDCNAGKTVPVGLLLAGNDCVAVDAVCTRIMGFDPYDVEHIALAEEAGLGTADPDRIEVLGESLEGVMGRHVFAPPANPFELAAQSGGGIRIVQGRPCSACLNELGGALAQFQDRLHEFKDVVVLVGPDAAPPDGQDRRLLVGNCLERRQEEGTYVAGCPPCLFPPAGTGSLTDALSNLLETQAS
ncbi:DUF362 domain-containing protein [Candidatus Latescibacterota bacterium]